MIFEKKNPRKRTLKTLLDLRIVTALFRYGNHYTLDQRASFYLFSSLCLAYTLFSTLHTVTGAKIIFDVFFLSNIRKYVDERRATNFILCNLKRKIMD